MFLFLKQRLQLPINKSKSGIRRPSTFNLLGYGFVPTYRKGEKGRYQLVAKHKAWSKLKASIKEITKKTKPMSFDERIERLKSIQRGWVNYFRLGSIYGKLKKMDEWIRNRPRGVHFATASGMIGTRSLEETRKEEKEPHPLGYPTRSGLCMDRAAWRSDKDGRLGSSPKPHPDYHYHAGKTKTERV